MMRLHPGAGVTMSWETLFPSSDERNNSFYRTLQEQRQIMVNQAHLTTGTHQWLELFKHVYLLSPFWFFVYLKWKLMPVPWSWLKMGSVLTLSLPKECPRGLVINLLSLPFNMCLYLVYKGNWQDLTNPGIWALGPKTLVSL
jgi:hypothetical protein